MADPRSSDRSGALPPRCEYEHDVPSGESFCPLCGARVPAVPLHAVSATASRSRGEPASRSLSPLAQPPPLRNARHPVRWLAILGVLAVTLGVLLVSTSRASTAVWDIPAQAGWGVLAVLAGLGLLVTAVIAELISVGMAEQRVGSPGGRDGDGSARTSSTTDGQHVAGTRAGGVDVGAASPSPNRRRSWQLVAGALGLPFVTFGVFAAQGVWFAAVDSAPAQEGDWMFVPVVAVGAAVVAVCGMAVALASDATRHPLQERVHALACVTAGNMIWVVLLFGLMGYGSAVDSASSYDQPPATVFALGALAVAMPWAVLWWAAFAGRPRRLRWLAASAPVVTAVLGTVVLGAA